MLAVNILLYLSLATYVCIIWYFYIGWIRIKKTSAINITRDVKVSVMIPVRNEADHIADLLNDLVNQNYPSHLFEIIIIDDHSTDNTAQIVKDLNIPNVKLIPLYIDKPFVAYKKKAITVAIENSEAELIISTDGDCRVGEKWISSIVSFYLEGDYKMISAPVSFHQEKKWYEKIQTIEFQFLIGVGAACIRNGSPSTCNGANLIYTRDVFHDVQGFKGIDDIAHGDDELFLHKVFSKYPDRIGFLKNEDAIVRTYAKTKLNDFVQQRKRWASKSTKYYNKGVVFLVSMIFLFNLSLLITGIASFFTPVFLNYLLVSIVLKTVSDGFLIFSTLRFFRKKTFIVYLPIVELFYVIYIILIGIMGNTGSTYNWKDREVK